MVRRKAPRDNRVSLLACEFPHELDWALVPEIQGCRILKIAVMEAKLVGERVTESCLASSGDAREKVEIVFRSSHIVQSSPPESAPAQTFGRVAKISTLFS